MHTLRANTMTLLVKKLFIQLRSIYHYLHHLILVMKDNFSQKNK